MSLLAGLTDGLPGVVNGMVLDTIKNLAEEFSCGVNEIAIFITHAEKSESKVKYWAYQIINGVPTLKREIDINEIIGT